MAELPVSTPTTTMIAADTDTDIDDSIVLSDLVRTGEASRLRRRGAMRIDHNHHPHHTTSAGHVVPGPPPRVTTGPNIMIVERSNWDSDSDVESPSFATSYWDVDPPALSGRFGSRRQQQQQQHPRLSSRRFGPYSGMSTQSGAREDEYIYMLVCGVEVEVTDGEITAETKPFVPSILPLYPPSKASSSLAAARRKIMKKTTGCGSFIHMHAAPKPKFRMWTARSVASDTVIPLESGYFETKEAARFSRSSCGCVTEGIGCAVCGNTLGTRYTPCKSASEGFFCPRLPEKLPHTAPPNASSFAGEASSSSSKSQSNKSKHYIYTFFSDAVTSTPSYSFPPPPVRPARSRSFEQQQRPISPDSMPYVPPERYLYSPADDEESSDAENYPPYTGGSGWRSITSPIFPSVADTSFIPMLDDNHPVSPLAAPTRVDRLANSSPVPMLSMAISREQEYDQQPPRSPRPLASELSWGVPFRPPSSPSSSSAPPSPPPLRTRTGRTARRTSLGRSFPSLSSGLGSGSNGIIIHDDDETTQPPQPTLSFYERQLIAASERETRDVRLGGGGGGGFGEDLGMAIREPWIIEEEEDLESSGNYLSPLAVDLDGDMVVTWGTVVPDSFSTTGATEVEYKPAEVDFFER